MAFVKLDSAILTSSLWVDREAREIFITALCMAVPHEITEPEQAIQIRSLDPLGFEVPAGWYGLVQAAGSGIVRQAGGEREAGLDALERLASPDPESRTLDHEGRRLVRVAGGFIVLNYDRYRQRDLTASERMRRYRNRLNQKNGGVSVTPVTRNNRNATANVTEEEEEEVEEEVEEEEKIDSSPSAAHSLSPDEFRSAWNAMASKAGIPQIRNMSPKRTAALKARARDPSWRAYWREALDKIPESKFLCGSKGWKANVTWFLKPDAVDNLLEGHYSNDRKSISIPSPGSDDGPF